MINKFLLPEPIEMHFHATNTDNPVTFLLTFHDDAVVFDAGKEYRGSVAISEHILEANKDAKVSMEITNCTDQNGVIVVTAALTGEFEGSPLPLDFHFALDSGKIKDLNITLGGE